MNKLVTYLSFFGAGCTLGVLGTKSYFERKYKDISDAEIESVKEVYKRKAIALEGEEKKEHIVLENVINKDAIGDGLFINMTPEHMKSMQINYNTLSTDIAEHPIEEDYKPYFIDVDDFDATGDGYSKHEYVYYMDDGTLADAAVEAATTQVDIEEEIVSAADTVGIDNLEIFENMDEEVCYIRNDGHKADYEVTKVFSSYSAIVGDDY